jgi:uncharacterized protein DUF4160
MAGLHQTLAMPKLDAFRIPGLDLWFNSADHKPPHFHAERSGAWEVRIYFLRYPREMVETKWGKPKKGELKQLLMLAEVHRAELFAEWERKVCIRAPGQES